MSSNYVQIVLLICCYFTLSQAGISLFNAGYCQQQISVKYQQPVVKTRVNVDGHSEQFISYEQQERWQTVRMCCAGYRSGFFGICRPHCEQTCPMFSSCIEPNKCACQHGYEAAHQQQLSCHPTCLSGCPKHSHCVAPNHCACRTGYKDVSHFFAPLRCARNKQHSITKYKTASSNRP